VNVKIVEIHELQTELSVFEARGVANFGTRCNFYRSDALYVAQITASKGLQYTQKYHKDHFYLDRTI